MSETSHKLDPQRAANPQPRAGETGPDRLPADEAGRHSAGASVLQSAEAGQYLTFQLAGDRFGLAILQVREILEFSPLTPVPLTPPWIRGVLNLRGNVVPVVDLAVKFGCSETQVTRRTCIVIVEVESDDDSTVMGVVVDAVDEVVHLEDDALEPAPEFGTRVRVDYLQGLGKVDDDLILLLEANRVLSTDELLAAEDAVVTGETPSAQGERA